jgi:alkaline phosphatase D
MLTSHAREERSLAAMPISRRQLLQAGAAAGASLVVAPGRAPAFVRSRPVLTHGIQSGDVTASSGVVWARADRPSRMLVAVLDERDRHRPRWIAGPVLTAESDYTGKVALDRLKPGDPVRYRVALQDLRNPAVVSEPLDGSFRTAPRDRRDVSFTWSGDLAGQGWGINPDLGGFRIFRAMAALRPTSSSAAATRSTRTAPSPRRCCCRTAASGATW